jgi:hypothetical protein
MALAFYWPALSYAIFLIVLLFVGISIWRQTSQAAMSAMRGEAEAPD